jgi:hypothetical protein
MKRTWMHLVVRVLPILVLATGIVIELEDTTGKKWM